MHDTIVFDHQSGQYIDVGDAQLYVETKGDPQRPTLVMLHGGFGHIEDFNCITPTLARNFRLIGLDSRGHGRSTLGKQPLSYALLADDLARVVKKLALPQFSILGFSDGGTVGYHYAASGNFGLEKMVTIGAGWELCRSDPEWGIYQGMTPESWTSMFPESYQDYSALNPAPDWDHFARQLILMWQEIKGYPGASVGDIEQEILVIRGEEDMLTSPESMAKLCSLLKKAHSLNIPNADHMAFIDQPACVLQAIAEFFNAPLPMKTGQAKSLT